MELGWWRNSRAAFVVTHLSRRLLQWLHKMFLTVLLFWFYKMILVLFLFLYRFLLERMTNTAREGTRHCSTDLLCHLVVRLTDWHTWLASQISVHSLAVCYCNFSGHIYTITHIYSFHYGTAQGKEQWNKTETNQEDNWDATRHCKYYYI